MGINGAHSGDIGDFAHTWSVSELLKGSGIHVRRQFDDDCISSGDGGFCVFDDSLCFNGGSNWGFSLSISLILSLSFLWSIFYLIIISVEENGVSNIFNSVRD